MRTLMLTALLCGMFSIAAHAADAPAVAVPLPAYGPGSAEAPAAPPDMEMDEPQAAPQVAQPVRATLGDGRTIEFDPDGNVYVIAKGGGKNVAPDGTLKLKDGTPFMVKDGQRVDE